MLFDRLKHVWRTRVRKTRVLARRSERVRPRLDVLEDRLAPSTVVAPTITLDPASVTVPAAQPVTFTAGASGSPAPAAQWLVSTDGGHHFNAIAGATSNALTFTARARLNGDEFEATFTNSGGRAVTTVATLTVDYAPRITTQPLSQTVTAGSPVTLQAAANSNPTATVQWQQSLDRGSTFDDIPGATSNTLSFTAPSSAGVVEYRAVFSNAIGTATTAVAAVLVHVPPAVTTQPTDQTVLAAQPVTFTAGASGSPTPAEQWLVSTDGGQHFAAVLGATSPTLSFIARARMNGDEFEAVFTNAAGRAVTTVATLIVDYAPRITTQPLSQTVTAGSPVTLQAAANSDPTATVQWQQSLDRGSTFDDIPGATSNTLSFTAPSSAGVVEYRAVFSNAIGTTTTAAAAVLVQVPPTVTTQPTDQTVLAGQVVTFTAAATGSPTPGVQWKVSTDGGQTFQAILGATSPTLSFIARARMNGYLLRAVFTNVVGRTHSTDAVLNVDFAPRITAQPLDQIVAPGGEVTLTAAALANPDATVQWQVSTDQGLTFIDIAGATANTLSFAAPASTGVLEYRAVFSNTLGTAITGVAHVTVGVAPFITANPSSVSANAGDPAAFTAAATGTPAPSVQWQLSADGGQTFQDITGATSTTLGFIARARMNGDLIRAVFSNLAGRTVSSAATLTVTFAPRITAQPSDQTVATGSQVTLSAAAISNPAATVQWRVSTDQGATFSDVPGATSAVLNVTAPSSAVVLEYQAVFTNALGTVATQAAVVTVDVPPVITLDPISVTASAGQSVFFTAAASGTPAPTVQWQLSLDGGQTFQSIPGATSGTLTFTAVAVQSGDVFRAVFTNPLGQVVTQLAELTVA